MVGERADMGSVAFPPFPTWGGKAVPRREERLFLCLAIIAISSARDRDCVQYLAALKISRKWVVRDSFASNENSSKMLKVGI